MPSEIRYEELINSIRAELGEGSRTLEIEDFHLKNIIEVQRQEETREYNERNQLYTKLLNQYIDIYQEKENAKKKYKKAYFIITMVVFTVIIVGCVISILGLPKSNTGGIATLGIAGVDIVGIVSSLIIIPKIIAEHLFPTNEESNMIDMVKKMQANDAKIREIIFELDRKNRDNQG
ncbi:MAG: hypothetical protein HFI77_10780 [Lachnospiraceae bacterium]|nr:hypothetical protein [Lachnospiraceae bacterium]